MFLVQEQNLNTKITKALPVLVVAENNDETDVSGTLVSTVTLDGCLLSLASSVGSSFTGTKNNI